MSRWWGGCGGAGGEQRGEALPRIGGDGVEAAGVREAHHPSGSNASTTVVPASTEADDHVARQDGRDGRVDLQRLVRQRRSAGTEDDLRGNVDVKLRLQGGLEVDLGQDAEPLVRKALTDLIDRRVVGQPQGRGQRVGGHRKSPVFGRVCVVMD